MTNYRVVYDLIKMLRSFEEELGLSNFSTAERDVFLAAQSLSTKSGKVVYSMDIRNHDLVNQLPPASYHRALRALVEKGHLSKSKGAKTKAYLVNNSADQTVAKVG